MNPNATEADMFSMISMSGEFDGIKAREEEIRELKTLMDEYSNSEVLGEVESAQGKTNILLQAYISKASIKILLLFPTLHMWLKIPFVLLVLFSSWR